MNSKINLQPLCFVCALPTVSILGYKAIFYFHHLLKPEAKNLSSKAYIKIENFWIIINMKFVELL